MRAINKLNGAKGLRRYYKKISLTGFTYVELVIAVGIIGILSIIVVVSYQNAQKNGRDRQRMSDLAQLQAALQTYYSRNGTYPRKDTAEQACDSSKGTGINPCDGWVGGSNWNTTVSDIYRGLITDTGILPQLPIDPKQDQTHFYRYEPSPSSGASCPSGWPSNYYCGYFLITRLESIASPNDCHCVTAGIAVCPSCASF